MTTTSSTGSSSSSSSTKTWQTTSKQSRSSSSSNISNTQNHKAYHTTDAEGSRRNGKSGNLYRDDNSGDSFSRQLKHFNDFFTRNVDATGEGQIKTDKSIENRNAVKNPFQKNNNMTWSSQGEFIVGHMDVGRGATSWASKALGRQLGHVKTLLEALKNMSKRPYNGGFPDKAMGWHSDKVGGEKFATSAFNPGSEKNLKEAKNIFVGISGWNHRPNERGNQFQTGIRNIANKFKDKFHAQTIIGRSKGASWFNKVVDSVRKYAMAHPDKPITLTNMIDTHGNHYSKGRRNGDGELTTLNMTETQYKRAIGKLKSCKNVSINSIFVACHAGAGLV